MKVRLLKKYKKEVYIQYLRYIGICVRTDFKRDTRYWFIFNKKRDLILEKYRKKYSKYSRKNKSI